MNSRPRILSSDGSRSYARLQRDERVGVAFLFLEPAGDVRYSRSAVALSPDSCGELRRAHARFEILGIERAEANGDFGRALLVAALALRRSATCIEVLLGVGQRALLGGQVAGLDHRVLVVRLDLEDLLVERRRLGIEPLFREVVGDAGVLLNAFVDLIGAYVQIAKRVGAVPVARLRLDDLDVLGDGRVDACPCFNAFSAPFSAASRSNGGTVMALRQWYQTGSLA